MKQCDRCDTRFSPKVSYQIYCSEKCRDEATREKIGGNIGNESEAYAMQNICRELFDAYATATKRKNT